MKVTPMSESRQSSGGKPPPVTAGVTLKAVEALDHQDTFTRAQVAYLMHLAFRSGAAIRTAGDMAELEAACEANFQPHPTREQRVRIRLAEMDESAARFRRDWEARRRKLTPPMAHQPTGLKEHDDFGRLLEPQVVPVGQRVNPDVEWPDVAVAGKPELRVVA